LNEAEKFDVIVFNDVLEHIPPVEDLLASCRKYLDDRGLLVVNLPSSDGILYRLAKSLHRMGASSFFDRLWQRGMPSPHVHYFNTSNLTSLLKNNGFDLECSGRLPSVRLNGLYARISYAGKRSVVERMALYAGIAGCLPLFDLLPSDIVYVIAKRS
jgi:hypothetical protein